MKHQSPYMTKKDAAAYIGKSVRWLETNVLNARAVTKYKFGRDVRIHIDELEAWAKRQATTTAARNLAAV